MKNLTTKKITTAAVGIALVFVTTFLIAIPIGNGFMNPSEIVIMVFAVLFGPYIGALAGIGAGMADLALGFTAWIPFTLFTKMLTGFLVGKIKNKPLAMFISTIIMVATYALGEFIIYSVIEPTQLIGNIIQCLVAVAVAMPIALRIKSATKQK